MSNAKQSQYDIAYIWDSKLESILDYQQDLEELLGPEASRKLHIVKRSNGDFGVIYDHNGTALTVARLMVEQSVLLREAGMTECLAVSDSGYHQLYNVSYALGPNLEDMKKLYASVYKYLGSEVGKNLYIEKTDLDNYTLIYRRRDDRVSTYKVAKKHAKLLRRKRIRTSITPEMNNPVIFGESSHLDVSIAASSKDSATEKPDSVKKAAIPVKTASLPVKAAASPVIIRTTAKEPVTKKQPTVKTVGFTRDVYKAPLEGEIESFIKQLRNKGKLSRDEQTGWVVYDLTSGKSIVDINADHVFQAASMIKPFVALAFFHKVKEGKLIYGPKSRRNMEKMIQRSNNKATNWVMRMAGGPQQCQRILQKHYGDIFQKTYISEYIPAGGKTYKNSAVPSDYIRFLQALWNNQLPYGKEIRRLMSLPGRDRLYDGTPIPQGTLVYNKTGSTAHLCGDMGIIVPKDKNGKRYPYAVAGVIQRTSRAKNYSKWMLTRGNVIRQVSTIVYEEMKKQYKL
ncbi:MAG: serine hydrolase [Desulfocapsaceae bacterium]|nr:serine hydrolase [Desulfocapsaceae bacterium]